MSFLLVGSISIKLALNVFSRHVCSTARKKHIHVRILLDGDSAGYRVYVLVKQVIVFAFVLWF